MVISLCQRKGGVGKTTSVVYLSQVLHQAGHEVIALDLDEDNSLVQWSQLVSLEYPVKRLVLKDLMGLLEQNKSKHIIIDTPPNSPTTLEAVVKISDIVVVPLQPTDVDLVRVGSTLRDINKVTKDDAKVVLLFNRVDSRSKEVDRLQKGLQAKGISVLKARIRSLVRYGALIVPNYLEEFEAVAKELELV